MKKTIHRPKRPTDPAQLAHSVMQDIIKLTNKKAPPRLINQIGKIIIRKKPSGKEAEFALLPCTPNNRQDDQRILFLSKVAGIISRLYQGDPKESSKLWGSDKALVIQVQFLKDFPEF
jgi:hypothetical protein